jgi:predicted 3-demethylubiquinone-9 3-methyltransferase (glyoxalase superfamily)
LQHLPQLAPAQRTAQHRRRPGPKGSVLTISFGLDGLQFTALNGGPEYKFTEAVSFIVRCETQEEVDYYWSKLTAGGSEIQCGWLSDKFGLCWQIVPPPARTPQASQGYAGHDEDEKARHRGTGAGRAIVAAPAHSLVS